MLTSKRYINVNLAVDLTFNPNNLQTFTNANKRLLVNVCGKRYFNIRPNVTSTLI